jgi:hypothetical protein
MFCQLILSLLSLHLFPSVESVAQYDFLFNTTLVKEKGELFLKTAFVFSLLKFCF